MTRPLRFNQMLSFCLVDIIFPCEQVSVAEHLLSRCLEEVLILPLIREANKVKRLDLATGYLHEAQTGFFDVIWSDECIEKPNGFAAVKS